MKYVKLQLNLNNMSYNIKQVLISRDGLTSQEADKEIKQLRQRVWNGENPEQILFNELRLEPDYIMDLI
jgi:hypothetical protein